MKKPALFTAILVFSVCTAFGQNFYSIDNIADSLKKNANAVLRFYNISYKRSSAAKYIKEVHYAISILNPKGKYASQLRINYDRNSRVSDIKACLYGRNGDLQAKLKKKKIQDYAANNNYTLFSDHRQKFLKPAVSSYPYTIEYKYAIEHSGVVGFETWMPQKWFNVSVETSILKFNVPKEFDIKHMELNQAFVKTEESTAKEKTYTWYTKGLKAIQYESHAPNYLEFMPAVLLSPCKFSYEGSKGDFSSWESYGKWVYKLIKDRDKLPEETIASIKNLTDTISQTKDIIKVVYKYMQGKTRYVNIALGIGGFQPISAMDVDQKAYGDCKALTNYTKALLKCAGINSFYTEIGTGKYQEIKFTDFASANQTNHIILCVPMGKDTIWLECTNQKMPFGLISPDCQNRYALLIKPNGGELAKTPSYNENESTRLSNIKLKINESGEAVFEIITDYNNNKYFDIFSLLNSSKTEQKQTLLREFAVSKDVEIDNFSIKDLSDDNAKARLKIMGKINNYASVAGLRIIFPMDFFHNNKFPVFNPDKRKLDIFEPIAYSYIDTLQICIPESYSAEYLHNSQKFNSVYGQCSYDIKQNKKTINVIRKIRIFRGRYTSIDFDEIKAFLNNISDYENKKIIIIYKE